MEQRQSILLKQFDSNLGFELELTQVVVTRCVTVRGIKPRQRVF